MPADIRSIVDLEIRRMALKMEENNSPDGAGLHFVGDGGRMTMRSAGAGLRVTSLSLLRAFEMP
jgi:hypothetical protein